MTDERQIFDWATFKYKARMDRYTEPHTHLPLDAPPPDPELAHNERMAAALVASWHGLPKTSIGIDALRDRFPTIDDSDGVSPWRQYFGIVRLLVDDRRYCPTTITLPGGTWAGVQAAPIHIPIANGKKNVATTWAALKAR